MHRFRVSETPRSKHVVNVAVMTFTTVLRPKSRQCFVFFNCHDVHLTFFVLPFYFHHHEKKKNITSVHFLITAVMLLVLYALGGADAPVGCTKILGSFP